MQRPLVLLATVLAVFLISGQALAEKRVALVIGNSDYTVGRLANPSNDAHLIAKTLRSLDFEVLEHTDLNQQAMKKAIVTFGERLDRAGEDAVGLFFYAGHGIQANGQNFLVPLGVELNRESHLKVYAVEANWFLAQMEEAGNAMNLVILDACRNNPFTRSWKRASTGGLARMEAPRGTLIAYATRPGDVAADGKGNNSPYTAALSKSMVKPGLSLSDMFIEVRNTVMVETDEDQIPWEEGGLTSRFYFKGGPITVAQPTPASQPQQATPTMSDVSVAWQTIQNSTNPEEIEAFILAFRSSPFAGMARAKLKALAKKQQVATVVPPTKNPKPNKPIQEERCRNRGNLDAIYCDNNGDLVADTPTDPSKWLNPDTLVFSYTPVKNPSEYESLFTEFMEHLAKVTGKKVKWYGADSSAAQVDAMRSGRLHVTAISTGVTVFGVNLAGYVPIAIMGKNDGTFGYKLQLITHKDTNIFMVSDLKGRIVAHVTPSSNSGNYTPRALFKSLGVEPDKDYKVTYSGKHDNSIIGVANKSYDAAPVASSVLNRMHYNGVVNKDKLRIIWETKLFPITSYGYVHNLHPHLQQKVTYAFLSFDWTGTALDKEFGKKSDRFIPINFKDHWSDIRTIQETNGVVYSQDALPDSIVA